MAKSELSEAQKKALELAAETGRLIRWPGGYRANIERPTGRRVPDRYAGTNTVYSLLRRGKFRVLARMRRGDAYIVELIKEISDAPAP